MNISELIKQGLISECDCSICQMFTMCLYKTRIYKLGNTSFYYKVLPGVGTFWLQCPRWYDSEPILIEELLERVDDEYKETILFNIDLFRVPGA